MVQGKFAEAAAEARETVRIFPEHSSAKVQLAISLAQEHQCDEAIPALRNAVLAMRGMSSLHKFLGLCLFQKKQTDYAIAELACMSTRSQMIQKVTNSWALLFAPQAGKPKPNRNSNKPKN